jgi:hypothetical protein
MKKLLPVPRFNRLAEIADSVDEKSRQSLPFNLTGAYSRSARFTASNLV